MLHDLEILYENGQITQVCMRKDENTGKMHIIGIPSSIISDNPEIPMKLYFLGWNYIKNIENLKFKKELLKLIKN